MRLAEKGFDVVAAVQIWAQVQTLKQQAAERGVKLQVDKLDVTDDGTAGRPWRGTSRSW
jgi:predicted secreted protein